MNTDILEGNWRQFKGKIQAQWGSLTDDALDQANRNREQFLGILQENYGLAREQAEKQLRAFEESMSH